MTAGDVLHPCAADALRPTWSKLRRDNLPYLSAMSWVPPGDPELAARWMAERADDHVFAVGAPEPAGVAGLLWWHQRMRRIQVVVLIADERWQALGRGALGELHQLAFDSLNLERCEWLVPEDWPAARRAADAAGYRLEATFPNALAGGGRRRALLLYGLLSDEWRAAVGHERD